jgi:DNA polymerase/3'-5' exonuclease PolX
MRLDQAERVARYVMGWLAVDCERIEVAGSVRRRRAEVKDIEIVYCPRLEPGQAAMFPEMGSMVPATNAVLRGLLIQGVLKWDREVLRNGPRYKRVIHTASGAIVELFRANPDNWGLIYALRTGPADFMKMLVSHEWEGGVMPIGMKMQDGYLWREGQRLATPTEHVFFEEMGLMWWPAKYRTTTRLSAYRDTMALVGQFE